MYFQFEGSFSLFNSAQSNNPDVLGSIFEGLDTLYNANPQVSRDGRLVVASDKSRDVVKHSQTKLTVREENEKNCGGVPKMKEETTEQKLAVVESKMISEAENPKPSFSSQNKHGNCKELSRPKNTSESISFSTSEFHASCSKANGKRNNKLHLPLVFLPNCQNLCLHSLVFVFRSEGRILNLRTVKKWQLLIMPMTLSTKKATDQFHFCLSLKYQKK